MKPHQIIVCMKPVPDPSRWDKLELDTETMLLKRDELPAVINPLDRNAIEVAAEIKNQYGGTISVITMAPPDAEEQLREALALGCDDAYLLTDPSFAGADSLVTARCLGTAIEKIGPYDIVFCGGYSLDGSTAQVGPQLAELLGLPDLVHVTSLKMSPRRRLTAECVISTGRVICESRLPVVVTCDKELNAPRLATMRGIRHARDKNVTTWSTKDLGLKADEIGLEGSPTRMLSIQPVSMGRKGEMLRGSPNEMATTLLTRLQKDQILTGEEAAS